MQAFDGIKVLDLTHVLAGPFAAYQLAVMGADVIKVERPGEGDMMRPVGGSKDLTDQGMGTHFLTQNANKRSITLNLKNEDGQRIARQLAEQSDVIIENYRTGAMDDIGLGYDRIAELNPQVVYCSVTGFGQNGPKASFTAYDVVVQAASGLMSTTGTEETRPLMVGAPVLDYGTGYATAFSIASALFQRTQTGKGQRIDVSMTDTALMLMSAAYIRHLNGEKYPLRNGNTTSNAAYSCYETADGQLMIGAHTPEQSARLWRALGEEQEAGLVSTLSVNDLPDRYETQSTLLRSRLMERTAGEWEEFLQAHGVPAARVRNLDEAVALVREADRAVYATLPSNVSTDASYTVPLSAFRYEHDGPDIHSPPPTLGEHTEEILAELGYGGHEISALRQSNAI